MPASPSTALPFENKGSISEERAISEDYLAFGNFAGLPSLTLPLGKIDGMPFGGNITCKAFEEEKVFDIALAIEEITGLKNLSAVK